MSASATLAQLGTVAGFELGQRLRRLSTWIYFALFLVAGFLFFIAAGGAFRNVQLGFSTGGKVMVNSPYTLATIISSVSYFAVLVTAAVSGQAVHQDFHHRTYPLLFTAPLGRGAYLGGRLLAALALLALVQSSTAIGCLLGSVMPFVDAKLIGANRLLAYLGPYGLLVLPNLLILVPLFFALGALTRRMLPVYVTAVVLFVGYLLASTVAQEVENKTLAALVDPFGSSAFERLTEYWTVSEKNSRLLPLEGVLLANRLLWLAVAAAMTALVFVRFRLAEPLEGGGRTRRQRAAAAAVEARADAGAGAPPVAHLRVRPLALLPAQIWLTFRETIKSVYFLVLALTGVLFVVVTARVSAMYGTPTYPVTVTMIELAAGGFALFGLLIVIIYAGELVWRERDARLAQIVDALPVPTWLPYASKLGALVLVGVVVQLVVMACGLGIQIASGYYRFQLPLYLFQLLGLRMVDWFHMVVLALFIQTVVNHKQLGHLGMVLYFVVQVALPLAGFEHKLYLYSGAPGYEYSDMNGYGHFLRPWGWFSLYWTLFALMLAVLSSLLWVRGQDSSLRVRLRLAVARSRGAPRALLAVLAAAWLGVGAFIFYNTNVLNDYRTRADNRRESVAYERQYKQHQREPQPRVAEVRAHFDLRPETRALRVVGRYTLANRAGRPIPALYVNLPNEVVVHRLALPALGLTRPSHSDQALKFYRFDLPRPLQPEDTTELAFDVEYAPRGFGNGGAGGVVMGNGSFIHGTYLPVLGYHAAAELGDDDERRKRGLPAKPRMADLYDRAARQRNYISADGDWITFNASVCTSPDQVAFVPGYLKREWREDGRRCFAFEAESPILNFYSVLSARYATRRDRWRDVTIEIQYQPGHEYNLERMIASVKASLDYFTRNFSRYQHRQLRIIEFPRYQQFAQSFPNTIPYSEGVGFIAKVDPEDDKDVDYPYYITAHEVAHQWWGHQVVGADVQGSTLLSESLAQYSALMVMKATFGPGQMKRFLRYELDHYLAGRALERKKELPLLRVENQPYIHYQKASLVFYALQEAIGEQAVNRALAALLAKHAFRGPPYPTSLDLIAELRRVTPPEQQGLITDLFETITLYENRALGARARALGGDRYAVTLKVSAKKLRADELGTETEVAIASGEQLPVGVLGQDGKPLLLAKQPLRAGEQEVELVVTGKPRRAGIDPLNMLIDRRPDDNLVDVELPP